MKESRNTVIDTQSGKICDHRGMKERDEEIFRTHDTMKIELRERMKNNENVHDKKNLSEVKLDRVSNFTYFDM